MEINQPHLFLEVPNILGWILIQVLSPRGRFISESCFLSSIDQVGKLNLKFIRMWTISTVRETTLWCTERSTFRNALVNLFKFSFVITYRYVHGFQFSDLKIDISVVHTTITAILLSLWIITIFTIEESILLYSSLGIFLVVLW